MTEIAGELRPPGASRYLGVLARYGIVWVTLALFVLLAATTDSFLTGPNLRNVLDQQATLLIAASVATLTMIAGGFDVSISAVAVAAPLVALRVENATGSVALALLVGCAFGLVVGAANGSIVAFARINSFITTLATSFIVFGIGYLVSERSIMRPSSDSFRSIARTRVAGTHYRHMDLARRGVGGVDRASRHPIRPTRVRHRRQCRSCTARRRENTASGSGRVRAVGARRRTRGRSGGIEDHQCHTL